MKKFNCLKESKRIIRQYFFPMARHVQGDAHITRPEFRTRLQYPIYVVFFQVFLRQ